MDMTKKNRPQNLIASLVVMVLALNAFSEILYVDIWNGDDATLGTQKQPLKTIAKAVDKINQSTQPGASTIKLSPGVHNLSKCVILENKRPYSKKDRFTIEAMILPDDPNWLPKLMPIIISTEPASKSETENYKYSADKYTVGFNVKINHVTVRGIKFLGNPTSHTWHYPVWRYDNTLRDLEVAQCLFVSDKHTVPYLSPVCAMGHEIVVDHCIFYNCHTPLIFWDAEGGESQGCAARYCIIDGANVAAVWTTQTAEDFEFHNNIITRSKYVWMRAKGNRRKYTLRDCVISDYKHFSGYGDAYNLYGQTGNEIKYKQVNIVSGNVILEEGQSNTFDTGKALGKDWPRNYLHPVDGSIGSDLGAGLFKKK